MVSQHPHAPFGFPGLLLDDEVLNQIELFGRHSSVHLGKTRFEHFNVDAPAFQKDLSDKAVLEAFLILEDENGPVQDQISEMGPCPVVERLSLLRGIDAYKPDNDCLI